MTTDQRQKKEARVRNIRKEIGGIPALLDGSLLTKHNRVKRKDGSVHTSREHFTFQYRDAEGKRCWKRVPRDRRASVDLLVRAGQRYRALDAEYRALLTELALDPDTQKKR